MDAIARDGSLEAAAVTKIDRHARYGPNGCPMQNKILAKIGRHLLVRVKRRAEESAVRATEFLVQSSEEAQGKDRLPGFLGLLAGLVEFRVPKEPGSKAVLLLSDRVHCGADI